MPILSPNEVEIFCGRSQWGKKGGLMANVDACKEG